MISAGVKANNNKKKGSSDCMLQAFVRSTLKTWNTM